MGAFAQGALVEQVDEITTTGGVTTLTKSSFTAIKVIGSASGHVIFLPDTTTMKVGRRFRISNESSEFIYVKVNSGTVLAKIQPNIKKIFELLDNPSADGVWQIDASFVGHTPIQPPFKQEFTSAPSTISHGLAGVPSMVFIDYENTGTAGEWLPLDHTSYIVKKTDTQIEFDFSTLTVNASKKLRITMFYPIGSALEG